MTEGFATVWDRLNVAVPPGEAAAGIVLRYALSGRGQ